MVKYECYRCGYNTIDKTKIRYHINRKIICRPINSDVNLEDCSNFILDGLSYKEYCEVFMSSKMSSKCNSLSSNLSSKCNNLSSLCQMG